MELSRRSSGRIGMIDKSKIVEHIEVRGSDGVHVGTVDHLQGEDRIKLTKSDPASGGSHHFVKLDDADFVDADGALVLKTTAADAMRGWTTA